MDDTRWLRWLQTVTRVHTQREIARKVGVSHSTVQRWVAKGVHPDTVWQLVVRFQADPIQALVVLGRIESDQVQHINWARVAEYMPTVVLTEELHKRATTTRREYPDVKLQKLEAVI